VLITGRDWDSKTWWWWWWSCFCCCWLWLQGRFI